MLRTNLDQNIYSTWLNTCRNDTIFSEDPNLSASKWPHGAPAALQGAGPLAEPEEGGDGGEPGGAPGEGGGQARLHSGPLPAPRRARGGRYRGRQGLQ